MHVCTYYYNYIVATIIIFLATVDGSAEAGGSFDITSGKAEGLLRVNKSKTA